MRRWLFFFYGVSAHAVFFLLYGYMAGFVGNFLVPKSIDTPAAGSITAAIVVDLLLLVAFGVQHSVMARPGFKRVWTRVVPPVIERSTYVWISTAVTVLLMWQWRGIDIVVWDAYNAALRGAIWMLFAVGWLLVPVASLLINHFDLFGTRQVWLHLTGRECGGLPFRTPLFYKHVRHPLYVGWAIAFWAIPTMTVGHLLFAVTLTAYMVIATFFEERDLLVYFGDQYDSYRRAVPKFIPRWPTGGKHSADVDPLRAN
jgi:protein-S-isoprenylcysteine O-methyltransferase Ste14